MPRSKQRSTSSWRHRPSGPDGAGRPLRPAAALALPLAFTSGLALLSLIPGVASHGTLRRTVLAAAGALLVWAVALFGARRRRVELEVALRRPHYMQACVQTSLFLYWGWYWREVYGAAALILAQLLFAYAVDILLTWSRRDRYQLGFGPFPIVLSINLFLWFRPEWFLLQLLMVAGAFAAKEFIRWEKDGRSAHIFNPSAFPLAAASVLLIATGTTDRTLGPQIASAFELPPYMAWWLFAIALPSQFFFGVTTMTMPAVATVFVLGAGFLGAFGTYLMLDSYIPMAVFLGMSLLFTDPATSPRTDLGRVLFGIAYGVSVVMTNWWLTRRGIPTFYDKILLVPVLNLLMFRIDRLAAWDGFRRLDPAALTRSLAPRQRHLIYMSVWALVFAGVYSVEGVGLVARAQSVPFWEQACREGRYNGCRHLGKVEETLCTQGSGWACNEAGILIAEGRIDVGHTAAQAFERSCALGFPVGCRNAGLQFSGSQALARGAPTLADYRILLTDGRGVLPERTPDALLARACREGWEEACGASEPAVSPASRQP